MSYTGDLVESYLRRSGQPRDSKLDAAYSYQWAVLRDMLARLEVILEDEDVPREVACRVLRCLLYGSPSAADAEQRMEQEADAEQRMEQEADAEQRMEQELAMRDLMARVPPQPVFFPGAAELGLPPR